MRHSRNREKTIVVLALLAALVLASCSGSGTGGSPTVSGISLSPLVVADHVSVVDPKSSGSPKPAAKGIKALMIGLITSSQLPATSDYMTDKTTVYVNERSTESFRSINEILCSIKQSRYDAMVNKGPYLALLDKNLCSSNRDNASSAGAQSTNQSSGSTMPNYELWTIDSYRSSESSPHVVRVWVFEEPNPSDNSPNGKLILARMTITEGADTAPPYGIFHIDFQALDLDPDPGKYLTELFRGVLIAKPSTDKALLQFASEDPAFHYVEKATLAKDPDGTSGAGTVYKTEITPPTATVEQFDIAYNLTHFLRHNFDNTDICLDRVNYDESAWRYGLYNESDGSRVTLNAGFSIRVGSSFGWVGYWGLWLPDGVTVADGDTVYQHDFQTNTDTPFTVFQSGGKLKKHTRKPLTLDKIKNVPLFWSDCSGGSCVNYEVITAETFTNSGQFAFVKVAQQNPAPDYTWQIITPAALDLSTLYSSDLFFWSQALSGQVSVKLAGCTYTGTYSCPPTQAATTLVIVYAEDIVYPGDNTVPLQLDCFDNCPNATATGIVSNATTSTPFLAYPGQTPYTFDFNRTALLLSYTTFTAVQTNPITGYDGGIMSGALFDPADIGLLACDPPYETLTCGWKVWSALNEFYTWETGLNPWNKFTGLINSAGTMVHFDAPLQVAYTHVQPDTLAPDYKYNGVTFYLEYNGFGNLSGIPGVCVDDQSVVVSCGPNTRWVPEFTIPDTDGSGNLTEVTGPGSTQYVVKALEKEQRMRDAGAECTTDGLTTSPYPLPSMTEWNPPANGPVPNITSGPKVIGGVVQ